MGHNLYIKLFHGRKTKEEDMDDWGFDGPVIGPLPYVHTTYASCIHIGDTTDDIEIEDGLVKYDGAYYGDWSVCTKGKLSAEDRKKIVKPTNSSYMLGATK